MIMVVDTRPRPGIQPIPGHTDGGDDIFIVEYTTRTRERPRRPTSMFTLQQYSSFALLAHVSHVISSITRGFLLALLEHF